MSQQSGAMSIQVPIADESVSADTDGVKNASKMTLGFAVLAVVSAVGIGIGRMVLQKLPVMSDSGQNLPKFN